jgi:hypothetical protein
MSTEKYASLTANLLMREGEAKPSPIAPSEPIAFPRASERAGARSLAQRASGIAAGRTDAPQTRRSIIAPIGVDSHKDGRVTLTISDAAEDFSHDEEAAGWVGDCGSFLAGNRDLFSETNGWHIAIKLDQTHDSRIEICHHNRRMQVTFGDSAASMFS